MRPTARVRNPLLLLPWALLLAPAGGCSPQVPRDKTIIDVRPERLGVGEKLVVEGRPYRASSRGVPALAGSPTFRANVERTEVILDGRFTTANGETYSDRVVIKGTPVPVRGNPAWAERVLAPITDHLRRELGWVRFEGKLGVLQQAKGGQPITAWIGERAPVRLELFPPRMRSLARVVVDWVNGGRVKRWLGVRLKPEARGLRVQSLENVEPGQPSLARQAGIQEGDLLVKAGKISLRNLDQLTRSVARNPRKAVLTLTLVRGGAENTVSVPTIRKPGLLPTTVVYLLVMGLFALVIVALSFVIAGVLTVVERKVAGRIQFRIGPNRVGPQGMLQWLADGIKLILKEDIIPDNVDKPLFKLAPYLVLMGFLGTFIVIPFGQFLIVADLNVGLLFLMAITGFVALGLMMAGWSSNNKWSLLGGMRSTAQIISYEIPTGLSLMVPVVLGGTLSTHALVQGQGGWPWQWYAFDNPLAFACFLIYFISALAEGNRTPFDLPEAESELVAGYNIEYSGWRFAVFFLSEWGNLFVIGAIATTVFLGGWQIPMVDFSAHASHWGWTLLGLAIFFSKTLTLVFVIIWIRWTLPRFRVDQMMALCWKYFVPWSFAAIVFSALWVWLAPAGLRLGIQVLTFALCGLGLTYLFFTRVVHNFRQNPEKKFSWNPFY